MAEQEKKPPPKPRLLADEHLVVQYEQAAARGNRAAQTRLDMLRAKLAAEHGVPA